MFSFAHGNEKSIRAVEYTYMFGKSVAQIHRTSDGFHCEHARNNLDFAHLIEEPLKVIKLHMGYRQDDYNFL